jgi:subtilisin family serine protease
MAKQRSQAQAKLQPKLRVIANGSDEVNAIRSEYACAVTVPDKVADRFKPSRSERPPELKVEKSPRLTTPPNANVSVFVQLIDEPSGEPNRADRSKRTARKANLRTFELPVGDAVALADDPSVVGVELGQPLAPPDPKVHNGPQQAPGMAERNVGNSRHHRFGANVLVGLIDVEGFDFSHVDFSDGKGGTRFVAIWDQGGDTRPNPAERRGEADPAASFRYGAELVKDEMDNAIRRAPDLGLPAFELEPQSHMVPGSHGTHVASIAAGNRGVARQAAIAAVLISIPEEDSARRKSFYDSTRIAHAVDYLIELAHELGLPLTLNISLGTNGHAHDDSSAVNRWIDAALTIPGRSVCVAAGNAGQERPAHEGDINYIMGRVHASGQVAARELVTDLEWNVVGNTIEDVSENELEIWFGPQDRLAVRIKPPGGDWSKKVAPGQFIENRKLPDGTFLSVYNELYHPANGANYIAVYLSPQLREGQVRGIAPGQWLIRLEGIEVRDGGFHAWIERDDPRPAGRIDDHETWVFPSFFSESSFVDASTVSTLACGQRIIAVGNLDEQARRISITSSQGPTRDGRQKPDIAAPGTGIVAAKGFTSGQEWVAMSGTSMASPYVAGVVGLMLATNGGLTGAQVAGIIRRSASPLPGADFSWRDDAGSGVLDAGRCVEEARTIGRPATDVTWS